MKRKAHRNSWFWPCCWRPASPGILRQRPRSQRIFRIAPWTIMVGFGAGGPATWASGSWVRP